MLSMVRHIYNPNTWRAREFKIWCLFELHRESVSQNPRWRCWGGGGSERSRRRRRKERRNGIWQGEYGESIPWSLSSTRNEVFSHYRLWSSHINFGKFMYYPRDHLKRFSCNLTLQGDKFASPLLNSKTERQIRNDQSENLSKAKLPQDLVLTLWGRAQVCHCFPEPSQTGLSPFLNSSRRAPGLRDNPKCITWHFKLLPIEMWCFSRLLFPLPTLFSPTQRHSHFFN